MKRLTRFALWGFALLGSAIGVGCAAVPSSGFVGSSSLVANRDGTVIAYRDSVYNHLYVADAKGVHHFGIATHYALSPSGRYLLMANVKGRQLREGEDLVLCEVDTGKLWTTKLPWIKSKIYSKKIDDGGIYEIDECGYHIDETPAVTIVLPMGVSRSCIRWRPGGEWEDVDLPPVDGKVEMNRWGFVVNPPIVEFPSQGLDERRTLWVRPDGSVMEIMRGNWVSHSLLLMPIQFWDPMYWLDLGAKAHQSAKNQEDDPKGHLAELVAQRKATATQPTTAATRAASD